MDEIERLFSLHLGSISNFGKKGNEGILSGERVLLRLEANSKTNGLFQYPFYLYILEEIIMSDAIQEQQPAPDFTLPAVGSQDIVKNVQVHLADLKGKTVVLYFYPKED